MYFDGPQVSGGQLPNTPYGQPAASSTTPRANNEEIVIFGGVKYYQKDVKSFKESTISEEGNNNTYHDAQKYEVTLNDGTQMVWTSHESKDKKSVEQMNLERQAEVQVQNDGTVNFKGLFDVNITDTEKNDVYRLLGCQWTELNADRTETTETGWFSKTTTTVGADNDNIIQADRTLPDGTVQRGRGTLNIIKVNEGDILNGEEQ